MVLFNDSNVKVEDVEVFVAQCSIPKRVQFSVLSCHTFVPSSSDSQRPLQTTLIIPFPSPENAKRHSMVRVADLRQSFPEFLDDVRQSFALHLEPTADNSADVDNSRHVSLTSSSTSSTTPAIKGVRVVTSFSDLVNYKDLGFHLSKKLFPLLEVIIFFFFLLYMHTYKHKQIQFN